MNLIRLSIERPTAILAAVIILVVFGFVALRAIPIQLIPDVRKPLLTITTSWQGASPVEIEREIVNRQEENLKGLESVTQMTSRSRPGRAEVFLEYALGTDMNRAMLLASNRLDQIGNYPDEAREPILRSAGTEDNPITWIVLTRLPGNDRPMNSYGDFVEDVVQERIERVNGVSRSNVFGGTERELKVVIHPDRLARYGLTVPDVLRRLRAANASISAGEVEEGKRAYLVRTEGELKTVEQVRNVVLRTNREEASGRIGRVVVGDIATVEFGFKQRNGQFRSLGGDAMAVNAVRETGANVIATMDGIRAAIDELNEYELPNAGLKATQSYDETVYIEAAIDLVQQNIFVGGTLAIFVLILFLRSWRATTVVALSIPVSIIGSFVAMAALGRSINVISLAGIAFAVGLVVDAAIVVLENIFRLQAEGHDRKTAAYEGAKQVWSAVLVSATTTVAVFAPVLLMEAEVGQLFRDIAVAISVAVSLSLIVAVTVIPALAAQLLPRDGQDRVLFHLPRIDALAAHFVERILDAVRWMLATSKRSASMVATICGIAALGTYLFLPKLDYLPDGNQAFVFGYISPPPGYNLETALQIAGRVENATSDMWAPTAPADRDLDDRPWIANFFFFASSNFAFVGAYPENADRAAELLPILSEPVMKEPGTFGFFSQRSLFGRGVGGGRQVNFVIAGTDTNDIVATARRAADKVETLLPRSQGHQMRPQPSLELGAPEVRITPNRVRLGDNGLSAEELGLTLDAFNDGLRVDEITVEGRRMDLSLYGSFRQAQETQSIENLPVVTRSGTILPASSLADIEITAGPSEINHLERFRVITLQVKPDKSMPLEQALELLEGVIDDLELEGIPPTVRMGLGGSADRLDEAWGELVMNLLLALVIVYLVMAVLFESFIYPLVIMLSVPLATAGGVAGLVILNIFTFQALDMLTLLGFVILIGIVVNNAILLVHQSLYSLRDEGETFSEAIVGAVKNRIRPIFMSTLTSIFGMAPLVLFPGAGSELYRGLGTVVIGGLMLSAVLTLLIIPPLMKLIMPLLETEVQPNQRGTHPAPVAD
jgi:hydrophobic/amphiphilic exporter-1 (mainly G- bacteria), HAE1 family